MNKLPNDIILNIIIKKYEDEKLQNMEVMKKLKKELDSIKFCHDNLEYDNQRMLGYLEQNEVKYCDECKTYGNDDEIILFEENKAYLCEYCKEWYDEQTEENGETYVWSS